MATEIAKAYVQIIPSADGVEGRLTNLFGGSAATNAGNTAGANIGKALVGTLTKIVAAAGIGKIIGDAMSEGGQLQQTYLGGLDTIYGEAAEKARELAEVAAKAGLSQSEWSEQAIGFGAALKQAYGGDMTQAVEAANTAIMDMTDNAAKMGTPIESIQNAYQGFAKQNYTMLDNLKLGYGGTKKEMERLLADAQNLSGVEYNIDNLGDVYDAIHVIQQELGLTGVAAQEASETVTGSAAALGAAWKNLIGNIALGRDWGYSIDLFAKSLIATANNVIPMFFDIVKQIPQVIMYAFEYIDLSPIFDTLLSSANHAVEYIRGLFLDVDFIGCMTTALQNMSDALPGVLNTLSGLVDAGVEMIGKIGEGLQTAIPEFIARVLPMLVQFTENIRKNAGKLVDAGINLIKNIIQGLIKALPDLIRNVPTIISNVVGVINDNMPKILKAGVEIIIMLIKGIIQSIPVVIENAGKIVKSIIDVITAGGWLNLGSKIIQLFGNGIKALLSFPANFISGMVEGFKTTITGGGWQNIGQNIITALGNGIKSLISSPVNFIKGMVTNVKTAITGGGWQKLGSDIINGIVEGLKAFGGRIKDTLVGFAKDALSAAKDFLGIKSPSKVMRDEIGKQIIAGAVVGIEKNSRLFDDAIESAFSVDNVSVNGQVSGLTPAQQGSTCSVTINVYGSKDMDEEALANVIMQKLTYKTQAMGVAFG